MMYFMYFPTKEGAQELQNPQNHRVGMPSLKLTILAPENGWLEDDPFLLGFGLF